MKTFIVLCFSLCLVKGSEVGGCNNYTVLSEADRAQGHIVINSNYISDKDDLVPGWYRFQGAAGDRMADKCVPANHCGTLYPGWLNGIHPTVSEGVVTRTVCYPTTHYFFDENPLLSCCFRSNNITVRNCGAFFVYELQKPPDTYMGYCGNGSAVDGCNNYTVLSEADRAHGHIVINASNYRGDRDDLVPGWYRFQGAAGDRMADKCVPAYHCGAQYPGWLNGTHPTVSEGVVNRTVCFNRSGSCCYWYQIIRIRNCGAYFVYELLRPRSGLARYCSNGTADANECTQGTVKCSKHANCTNTFGSYKCSCNIGYHGNGSTCDDIDECAQGDGKCSKEAYCVNLPGTYSCNCKEGFSRDDFNCVASGTTTVAAIFCPVVMLVAVGLLEFMM